LFVFSELHTIVSDHPNIVTIHDSYEDPEGVMWICMDVSQNLSLHHSFQETNETARQLCEGGDLEQCLKEAQEDGIELHEDLNWSLFSQLVSAIRYCHDPDSRTGDNPDCRVILHRDLKPANSE
jgi:serine/threonine protein kinase